MSSPKDEIEGSHGNLHTLVKSYLPDAMTITVVSLSKRIAGQMILHHPEYDKRLVAERLRMCAGILGGEVDERDAEIERLRAVIRDDVDCPRPANAAPDGINVGQCMERGDCGCCFGVALGLVHQQSETGKL